MTKIILYLLTFLAASYSFALKVDNTIPVVLWHGMGNFDFYLIVRLC